jgi:3-keto-disaccharide hydrolase
MDLKLNYMKNKQFYGSILMVFLAVFLFTKCNSSNEVLFEENGNNWFADGDATWEFENGELVGTVKDGAGFVMTEMEYTDFVLELEFKPDSTINSGVFIRCKNKELSNVDCYEINVWDLHPNQESRTGAVVSRTTPMAHVETLNKWNTYKIRNKEDHLQVWIDGVLTADLLNTDLISGPIALQAAESGEIRFRNVKIRPL